VNATGATFDVLHELRAICGDENARERPVGGVYVSPATAEEVAAVLRLANERRLSVGCSGGSTEFNATKLHVDIVLHTNRLTEVEHYDHADLTVGIGAGTTIAQLNAMVGCDQLLFGGDPSLPERCTVGGLLATAAHGPMRHGFGGVRDYCIGVRFVTGDARRAKGGGRVVKNVAGYDLMKLLIGSYGTLAVITSASFKLFPAPRQTRTFLAEFATAKDALSFRDLLMRSPLSPMCLELVSPSARKIMRPEMEQDAWVMCVRAAGSDAVLARYRKELGSAVTRQLESDGEIKMWRAIGDFAVASALRHFHVNVRSSDVLSAVDTLNSIAGMAGIDLGVIGRVGIGHLLVAVLGATTEASAGIDALISVLHTRFTDIGIKVEGASNPWPIPPMNLGSMRAVKQALDPNNVLRGRQIS